MVNSSDSISLLRSGVVLPHYRILSSFFDEILRDDIHLLDINCQDGDLCELISIMYPYNIKYTGIDEDKESVDRAIAKGANGLFRATDYSKMKLKTNSYDVVVAQGQFLDSDNIIKKMDLLFRVSRGWVILFDFLVLQEGSRSVEMKIGDKTVFVHGLSYFNEILNLMEPTSIKRSFVVKTNDPVTPTSSVFAIKI